MPSRLALEGGDPVRTRPWPRWPVSGEPEERAVLDVVRSGAWGIGGQRVPELECRFAGLHDARYAVACANGTVAIEIALIAAGIEPGDEVITSPYTFMATALAILTAGGIPVFVDIDEETHNLDPARVEAAVTGRTRAILPVHIGGRPCDMDALTEIASRHGLVVVEDAAQAWLASWRGRPVGAIGAAGTFSFQSSKNLSAGEGGMVVTNDEALFHRAWSYHNCGRTLGGAWYEHAHAGLNYRMTELQAALLHAGLDRLPEQQAARTAAMDVLRGGLGAIEGLRVPADDARVTAHAGHIFMVRLDPDVIDPARKGDVVEALRAEGIPAHPGYTTPLYRQSFFDWFAERPTGAGPKWRDVWPREYGEVSLPVCERLCRSTIWIKQEVLLAGPDEMHDVVGAFDKVIAAARAGGLPASEAGAAKDARPKAS